MNAISPRSQLRGGVKIIVAFVLRNFWIITEPGVVPPTVQADVANRGSNFFRGLERAADYGLIDVAEGYALLAQSRENLRIVPGGMPHFHRERVICEAFEN